MSLLKEGGGRLSVWTLRACSYKTKTEADTRAVPHILFKGVFLFLSKGSKRQRDKETKSQRVKEFGTTSVQFVLFVQFF